MTVKLAVKVALQHDRWFTSIIILLVYCFFYQNRFTMFSPSIRNFPLTKRESGSSIAVYIEPTIVLAFWLSFDLITTITPINTFKQLSIGPAYLMNYDQFFCVCRKSRGGLSEMFFFTLLPEVVWWQLALLLNFHYSQLSLIWQQKQWYFYKVLHRWGPTNAVSLLHSREFYFT